MQQCEHTCLATISRLDTQVEVDMTEKMKSIMEAADRITVRSIASTPYCPDMTQAPAKALAVARERSYDWLPIREDGFIRRVIQTKDLEGLTSWDNVARSARKVTVDD